MVPLLVNCLVHQFLVPNLVSQLLFISFRKRNFVLLKDLFIWLVETNFKFPLHFELFSLLLSLLETHLDLPGQVVKRDSFFLLGFLWFSLLLFLLFFFLTLF